MSEHRKEFTSGTGIHLEGLLSEGTTGQGVVITHPHPLYGGDMRNIVVETIQQAYQRRGHTTLRFNFRGVGRSTGAYDDGDGEQTDVAAAIDILKEKHLQRIDLAGYSFGAWVIARMITRTADRVAADAVILISPPAAMLPFESTAPIPTLKLVVTGSADEFAPPELVKNLVDKWNSAAAVEVISEADHFFYGFTNKLFEIIQKNI